jgi:hypothetical protein
VGIAVNICFGDKCNCNPVSIEYNYMSFSVDKQNYRKLGQNLAFHNAHTQFMGKHRTFSDENEKRLKEALTS